MTSHTDQLDHYKKCYLQQKKLRIKQEQINRKLNARIEELLERRSKARTNAKVKIAELEDRIQDLELELKKRPTIDKTLDEMWKEMEPLMEPKPTLNLEPTTEDTIRILFGSEPPLAERVEEQYDYKRMVEWICSEAGQKGKGHKTVRVALHKQFGYGVEEHLANRGYKSKEPTNNLVRTDMVCPRTGISVATFRAT